MKNTVISFIFAASLLSSVVGHAKTSYGCDLSSKCTGTDSTCEREINNWLTAGDKPLTDPQQTCYLAYMKANSNQFTIQRNLCNAKNLGKVNQLKGLMTIQEIQSSQSLERELRRQTLTASIAQTWSLLEDPKFKNIVPSKDEVAAAHPNSSCSNAPAGENNLKSTLINLLAPSDICDANCKDQCIISFRGPPVDPTHLDQMSTVLMNRDSLGKSLKKAVDARLEAESQMRACDLSITSVATSAQTTSR
jgi:hypothetical protein